MTAGDPVKLRSPGDVAALVPHLVGFHPCESLVAVALRPPRKRVGLVLRVDLRDEPALVHQVVESLLRDGPQSSLLIVHSEAASTPEHPWSGLVRSVEQALAERGVDVEEALLVRAGRWWSYRCVAACCPSTGTLLDRQSPAAQRVAAAAAYEGRAVLPTRADLVASVGPVLPLGAAPAEQLQAQARVDLAERRRADPAPAERRELQRWRAALLAWQERPARPEPAEVAALVVALRGTGVRDEVMSWGADRDDALLGLLLQVAQGAVPPDDAPVCTVLAWVGYARGDGALALIALERALASEPGYSAATLLLAALDGVLPPAQVREVLRGTAQELQAQRRGGRRRERRHRAA